MTASQLDRDSIGGAPVATGDRPRRRRFGAGLLGHISSHVATPMLLSAAEVCENAGFETFWVADQRFMRDAFVSLAHVADHTRRIHLGTRVTDPYVRHPALTAVAVATLDEMSGGRAILGIGAGGSGFSQLGLSRTSPATAIREAVDLIRRLWRGGPVEFHGKVVNWERGELEFECRPDIPVVVAARGPKLLELAGEIAEGVVVATGVSREGIAWARGLVNKGEKTAGRRDGATELLHMTYITIDRDRALARNVVKKGIVGAVIGSHPGYEFLAVNGLEAPAELHSYLDSGERDRARIADLIPDSFVDKLAIAGSIDECTAKVNELFDAGIEQPLISPIPVTPGSEVAMLQVFAERVAPALRLT